VSLLGAAPLKVKRLSSKVIRASNVAIRINSDSLLVIYECDELGKKIRLKTRVCEGNTVEPQPPSVALRGPVPPLLTIRVLTTKDSSTDR